MIKVDLVGGGYAWINPQAVEIAMPVMSENRGGPVPVLGQSAVFFRANPRMLVDEDIESLVSRLRERTPVSAKRMLD